MRDISKICDTFRSIPKLRQLLSPQANQAVFVEASPATMRMLRLISPFVAHGAPTLKVLNPSAQNPQYPTGPALEHSGSLEIFFPAQHVVSFADIPAHWISPVSLPDRHPPFTLTPSAIVFYARYTRGSLFHALPRPAHPPDSPSPEQTVRDLVPRESTS
jgi:hypothetical protein